MSVFIGKLEHIRDRVDFKSLIGLLKGKVVKLTLTEHKETRSLQQNKYYWACIQAINLETNGSNTKTESDQLHDFFKSEFLSYTVPHPTKKSFRKIAGSTTDLNTKEFTSYMENIRKWALENINFRIPSPDDKYYEEFILKYSEDVNYY